MTDIQQQKSADDLVYDASVNDESMRLAYEESLANRTFDSDWADSLDGKTVTVFSVGAAILGIAPNWQDGALEGVAAWAWIVALVCWGLAALSATIAYAPRDFRATPSPSTFVGKDWRKLPPEQYRYYSVADMGKSFSHNRVRLNCKGKALRAALVFTALEVLSLGVAFVADRL